MCPVDDKFGGVEVLSYFSPLLEEDRSRWPSRRGGLRVFDAFPTSFILSGLREKLRRQLLLPVNRG